MRTICATWIAVVASLVAVPAQAWWGDGHGIMTEAAVLALPEEMPAFFRQGGDIPSHVAFDPDLFKNRGVSVLRHAEEGEHYFDLEYLEERAIPPKRFDFIVLCQKLGLKPTKVGMAPYAIAEWTGRLAVAFAEHRQWPENEAIQQKSLVYAGILAHYAQDICQPLHATRDYDGKKQADGTVIGKGIHEQVDSAVERLGFAPEELATEQDVAVFDSLMKDITGQIKKSNWRVEEVYALWGHWEDENDAGVRALTLDLARTSVRFTASLYLTAWQQSAEIRLPRWLER